MNKVLIEILRIVIALAIIASGYGAFRTLKNLAEKPPKKDIAAQDESVETVAIELREGRLAIDVDGVAVPFREIPVAAEASGRITQMDPKVRAGKFVEQGEFLMQLDNRDYLFEVARLRSEITQAENSLTELDVDRKNTNELLKLAYEDQQLRERELTRVKALKERRAASVADVDVALRTVIQAKNAVAQVENQQRAIDSKKDRLLAGVDLKKVQLQRAELDLKRTTVTAPISGVIVEAPAEEDAYVQRGAPLLTIEDTSRVEIRSRLKLDELYWLWRLTNKNVSASEESPGGQQALLNYEIPHAEATVSLEIGERNNRQRFEWEAELSRFEGIGLDERTRTMPCRILVRNPRAAKLATRNNSKGLAGLANAGAESPHVTPPALIRGMFVDVRIHVPINEPLLAIPDIAIRPGGRVWLFEPAIDGETGQLRIVDVDVIRYTSDSLALVRKSEGLDESARVVISPLVVASDGMRVRHVVEEKTVDEKTDDEKNANAKANSQENEEDPA